MPGVQVRNPNGAFGATAGDPVVYGDVVGYFVASATVTAGNAVIIDTANLGQVKPAATNSSGALIIGVASESGVTGDVIAVTHEGRTTATSNTAITAGDRLGLDATTAANLATVSPTAAVTQQNAVGIVVATALETVTSGVSSVRVYVHRV